MEDKKKLTYFLSFIELPLVAFALLVIILTKLLSLCNAFPSFTFDSQNILLWNILAAKGFFPYRDMFYPYGLLSFYRDSNLFWHVIYILSILFLFIIIFSFLKKSFFSKWFTYTAFTAFVIFIYTYTGFETFSRYGILPCSVIVLAYLYSKELKKKYITIFLLGILNSIFFIFYTDQGIYSLLIACLFFICDPILKSNTILLSSKYYLQIAMSIATLLFGFFLGILPFGIWLYYNHALISFFNTASILSSLSSSAKFPFLLFFYTRDNLFTFFFLLLAIFVSCNQFLSGKSDFFIWKVQSGLIIAILLFEQKNILRPIDTQITFIAFLLFFVLFIEFKKYLDSRSISNFQIYGYFLLIIMMILFHFRLGISGTNKEKSYDLAACYRNNKIQPNLAKDIARVHPEYKDILSNISGNFFTFPEDMLLYAYSTQQPPYFMDIYTATSETNQKNIIKYIEKNHINTIIYNTNILSHDMVPDYVRGRVLLSYLLTNFHFKKSINNFFILYKNELGENRFDEYLTKKQLHTHLLNIDLSAIPREENKSTSGSQTHTKIVFSGEGNESMDNYLKKNPLSSEDLVIVLKPQFFIDTISSITITTTDHFSTNINYDSCKIGQTCTVDLNRVPLFFKTRNISQIQYHGFKGTVLFEKGK